MFAAANPTLDPSIRTFIAFQRDIVEIGRRVSAKAAAAGGRCGCGARERAPDHRDHLEHARRAVPPGAAVRRGACRRRWPTRCASRRSRIALLLPLGGGAAGDLPAAHAPDAAAARADGGDRRARPRPSAVIDVPHVGRGDEIGQLARTVRTLSEVRATLVTREAEADLAQQHQQAAHAGAGRIADEFEARLGALLGEIAGPAKSCARRCRIPRCGSMQVSSSTATAASAVNGAGGGAQRTTDAALRLEQVIEQINAEVRRVSETATAAAQEAAGTPGARRPADRERRPDPRRRRHHRGDRAPDQSARAQRDDRGGAGRRPWPRLRGRRQRGQGARRPDRRGDGADRRADRAGRRGAVACGAGGLRHCRQRRCDGADQHRDLDHGRFPCRAARLARRDGRAHFERHRHGGGRDVGDRQGQCPERRSGRYGRVPARGDSTSASRRCRARRSSSSGGCARPDRALAVGPQLGPICAHALVELRPA